MTRRLETIRYNFSGPGAHTLFHVPADHKYEVVGASWTGDLDHDQDARLFVTNSDGDVFLRDQFLTVPPRWVEYHGYEGLVVYADEYFVASHAASDGGAAIAIDYVIVDFSGP